MSSATSTNPQMPAPASAKATAGPPKQGEGGKDQGLQPWQFFVLGALGCATAVTFIARGQGITSVVLLGLLMGTAALVGGLTGPVGGWLGDRFGFRNVLVVALAGGGSALALMPFVAAVGALAGLAVVLAAATSTISAMVFGMLATEVPPDRRSATLNLVYLPLYAAGIVGPAIGGIVVRIGGIPGPFLLGASVFVVGAIVIVTRSRRSSPRRADATSAS